MRNLILTAAALALAGPAQAAEPPAKPAPFPAPTEIVAAAPQADWTGIDPADLLVMDLAPDAKGRPRRVVIQLLPAPFSQGWVGNVRKLAAAHWWDGLSIYRVQDNYVTQWGDPDGDDKAKARALPAGLVEVPENGYISDVDEMMLAIEGAAVFTEPFIKMQSGSDPYSMAHGFSLGWPLGLSRAVSSNPRKMVRRARAKDQLRAWPVHCYGMVGVGRDMPPNTGTGAELYTVIGHAPRHLDRNIALIGRIIEGMEHMSSLPRGHGPLGFYDAALGDERVPIVSVRPAAEVKDLPAYEYLSTESASFAKYADARANRRDPFYLHPAGGADICNIPVPVRRVKG
jgi:peptidylprolyl isomerase